MTERIIKLFFICLLLIAGYFTAVFMGWFGHIAPYKNVTEQTRSAQIVQLNQVAQDEAGLAAGVANSKQILFGDLHVHTTFSFDAFQSSLQMMGGEGAHPPADACDFARFCSALDFYSINDHAESLTPDNWSDTKKSIQQCNAVSGDGQNPDLVAFLGWEWTHAGTKPSNHYGHKNIMLKDYADDQVPTRPIYAQQPLRVEREATPLQRMAMPLLAIGDRQRAFDYFAATDALIDVPECEAGVHVKDLPSNCREGAATPKELFKKLDQWGYESMVIPHGNTWGNYTPPGTKWDKQLKNGDQDDERQHLIEMYSGHGNSEEYRDWQAVVYDKNGNASCPAPSHNYLPSCWRAGEIIEARCLKDGLNPKICESRAIQARQYYAQNGIAGHNTAQGTPFEEWLNSGQCQDCDRPSFNYRPKGSAQYALSLTHFNDEGEKKRFQFGLIGSSDNHQARPGTGYKEYSRFGNTEVYGVQNSSLHPLIYAQKNISSEPKKGDMLKLPPVRRYEHERSSSFYYTGGLVAVHSQGRDRQAIWDALQRKEVYATNGERMLLWFDMIDESGDSQFPMGSKLQSDKTPSFRVTAVGAYQQKPGCPDDAITGFGPENIENICRGECYNPSDERKQIERIEIVRIEPQMFPDEPIISPQGDSRIKSVWKSFECPADPQGCTITFSDDEFKNDQRDVVYYARAIQTPTPHINAGNLRCDLDDNGQCIKVNPCYGDDRTARSDQCQANVSSKAWSSPIFVDYKLNPNKTWSK